MADEWKVLGRIMTVIYCNIYINRIQYCTLKTNVLKTTQPVLYFNTPVCQVKDNTFCVNFNSTSVIFFLTQVDILKIFNTLMCHNDTNMTQIV